MILTPDSEAGAAEIVRLALENREPLAICGGNTRAIAATSSAAKRLSSCALQGIVAYDPAEMLMTARPGTPIDVVEAALAANRQMMAFEPMDHRMLLRSSGESTIGGVFAANVSGPRRFVAGAARDGLVGIRFINGKGEVIRAGGRVMKNVTGLDLVKLLAGSHGTLGFLSEVTFRVLPVPETVKTVVLSGLDDSTAAKAMAAAMASSVGASGAAHLPDGLRGHFMGGRLPLGSATVFRLEGQVASVAVRSRQLVVEISAFGPTTLLGSDDSRRLWSEIRDVVPFGHGEARPVWRVSIAPTTGHQFVSALRREASLDAFYDWQGGLVWLRMSAKPDAPLVRRLLAAFGGGHATLMNDGAGGESGEPGFEPLPGPIAALSARIKHKLDPAGIFSPGKMW